jgi:hypothetical protein
LEQLGLIILIALFWLVRFIVRSSRARETPVPRPPSRRGPPVPDDEEVVMRAPRPVSAAGPSSVVRAQPPARLAGRQPRWRTVLGTPQELRRAIVLREVLGPCRAIDGL